MDYKPIDPAALRLPAPQPPSERLLAAVEAFYSPPSHERPRNRLELISFILLNNHALLMNYQTVSVGVYEHVKAQ